MRDSDAVWRTQYIGSNLFPYPLIVVSYHMRMAHSIKTGVVFRIICLYNGDGIDRGQLGCLF